MEKHVKFLLLSDIHGNVEALAKLKSVAKDYDAVLCAGDFAEFGKPETGKPALEALLDLHDTVYSVIGNCDQPEFLAELEAADISVQKALVMHEGLAISGSGGGSRFTGTTPYERDDGELAGDFSLVTGGECYESGETCAEAGDAYESGDSAADSTGAYESGDSAAEPSDTSVTPWNNLIAIMHNPPKDCACDEVQGGVHVGSAALRRFVEEYQPLAVLTGHIHESVAVDKIGGTTVINPGPLLEGKYAALAVSCSDGQCSVDSVELHSISAL